MTGTESPVDFSVSNVSVAPMAQANLCKQIGGNAVQPNLTISHTAVAGVPISVRMYDVISDGSTYEHRRVRTTSEADGTTVVSSGFLPPCNTTGRTTSSYRFDISAGGETTTVGWGTYDSTSGKIGR